MHRYDFAALAPLLKGCIYGVDMSLMTPVYMRMLHRWGDIAAARALCSKHTALVDDPEVQLPPFFLGCIGFGLLTYVCRQAVGDVALRFCKNAGLYYDAGAGDIQLIDRPTFVYANLTWRRLDLTPWKVITTTQEVLRFKCRCGFFLLDPQALEGERREEFLRYLPPPENAAGEHSPFHLLIKY